jgi:hypothetical protein
MMHVATLEEDKPGRLEAGAVVILLITLWEYLF